MSYERCQAATLRHVLVREAQARTANQDCFRGDTSAKANPSVSLYKSSAHDSMHPKQVSCSEER